MSDSSDRPELDEKLTELDILKQSLDDVKLREKDVYDQLVRLTAEFQNFRKRSEQRIQDARKAGREDVLLNIISIADVLTAAEASSRNAKDLNTLKKGLELVKSQFEKFLTDQGLVPIKAMGEKLDPHRHEAVARINRDDLEEGVVVEEIQRGYTLNGQVVRPARVGVSANPEQQTHQQPIIKEEQHNG